jgi:hypothetical protein
MRLPITIATLERRTLLRALHSPRIQPAAYALWALRAGRSMRSAL